MAETHMGAILKLLTPAGANATTISPTMAAWMIK